MHPKLDDYVNRKHWEIVRKALITARNKGWAICHDEKCRKYGCPQYCVCKVSTKPYGKKKQLSLDTAIAWNVANTIGRVLGSIAQSDWNDAPVDAKLTKISDKVKAYRQICFYHRNTLHVPSYLDQVAELLRCSLRLLTDGDNKDIWDEHSNSQNVRRIQRGFRDVRNLRRK